MPRTQGSLARRADFLAAIPLDQPTTPWSTTFFRTCNLPGPVLRQSALTPPNPCKQSKGGAGSMTDVSRSAQVKLPIPFIDLQAQRRRIAGLIDDGMQRVLA